MRFGVPRCISSVVLHLSLADTGNFAEPLAASAERGKRKETAQEVGDFFGTGVL